MRYPTPRKTVEVIHLITSFNRAIARATSREEQKAFCFAIEKVLHNSGNYAGYGYLLENYSEASAEDKESAEYARAYYLSQAMHAAYRETYQWCSDCNENHVIDPDARDRCSWCKGFNVKPD